MSETSISTEYKAEAQLVPWWLVFLEGLVALGIGIYFINNPLLTIIYLVRILGIYWLITGILTLIHLFTDRSNMIWKLISGIVGILAGLAVIGYPLLSALIVPATYIMLMGVLGICSGAISLFWALKTGWGAIETCRYKSPATPSPRPTPPCPANLIFIPSMVPGGIRTL